MLIVYGWKTKIKTDKRLGNALCENCKHDEERYLAREVFIVNIFGIPVFKKTNKRIVLCANCGIIEQLDKREYNQRLNEI